MRPGTVLAPLFAIDGQAPPLVVDAHGRVDIVLPPRAGWVWMSGDRSGPVPAAGVGSTIDPVPATVEGDLRVSGSAPGLSRLWLVLDGDIIAPADGDAIVMRRRLANNGLVTVAIHGKLIEVASLGLPLDEDQNAFVEEACADVAAALGRLKGGAARDSAARIEAARLAARRAAQRWSGKKPQVQVLLLG